MIKIYNVKNHKLDSDKLTFLNIFNSDDFCGVAIPPQNQSSLISDVFKLDSNGKVTINDSLKGTDSVTATDLTFINGGTVLDVPFSDIQNINLIQNHFYYIKYEIGYSFDESNVYNDNFEKAIIENTEYKNYTVTAYDIHGTQTLPDNDNCIGIMYIISLIKARNKSSFEQWLSAKSLDNLWETLHKTFTHQSGSTAEHPEYGKLGEFNVIDNTISHNTTQIVKVEDDKFILPTYKSDKDNALYTDKNGKVLNGNLPIEAGGTNASNKNDAKNNLGIYYGISDPEVYCTNNNITPVEGDIYFKILN